MKKSKLLFLIMIVVLMFPKGVLASYYNGRICNNCNLALKDEALELCQKQFCNPNANYSIWAGHSMSSSGSDFTTETKKCISCYSLNNMSEITACRNSYCNGVLYVPDSMLEDLDYGVNLDFCLDTSAIWQFIGNLLLIIKILVPLAIIVLGIVDLAKAVTSNDDKALNKAIGSVIKRVVMGIAIFFVPVGASFVFSMIKGSSDFTKKAEICQVCVFRPNSEDCNSYKQIAKDLREERNK